MFGNKDKRVTATDRKEGANAALRAEVARLEALPMAQLAAEVMVRAFGPGTDTGAYHRGITLKVHGMGFIAREFAPEGADIGKYLKYDKDLMGRLHRVLAEGLQVLDHQSLICVYPDGDATGYTLTHRGRAALEADAVEQALRGASAEPA